MSTFLVAWLGFNDIDAAAGKKKGLGPIGQAVTDRQFDEIHLISNLVPEKTDQYFDWVATQTTAKVVPHQVNLPSGNPTNYRDIHAAATSVVESLIKGRKTPPKLVFHLSPGTPAMAATWIILGKTRYQAELIQSSEEGGVETADVPFDISAEFIASADRVLERKIDAKPPETATFGDIVCRSPAMLEVVRLAGLAAKRDVSVLIEGESGTGKELLAKAIHGASNRNAKPPRVVNCGAIPRELIESLLFGHAKGSFTGATLDRKGEFELAHGSTLFLDEIGELPLDGQVRLLRVLNDKLVTRVGDEKAKKVDVRIIAATNRDLATEVAEGRFREDLYYRLAVATIKLPPLRDRKGDLTLLIDHLLAKANEELSGSTPKRLTVGARNALLAHDWPGNVRELDNTLRRLVVWSETESISAKDVEKNLLLVPRPSYRDILGRPLGDGFSLEELLDDVSRDYIQRAMEQAGGVKARATELLGMSSYMTLGNWMKRLGVD